MKAFNHKWIGTAVLLLVMLLAVAGCQPASKEQPTATPPLPPPTATATVTPGPSPTYTPSPLFTHIYAFGGTLSDNGNNFKIIKEAVDRKEVEAYLATPSPYSWEGRLSNGPVAVEILADQLNVGLTDYAVAGATSGYEHLDEGYSSLFKNTGLLGQVDKFQSELNGKKADPGSLFFIEIDGLADHAYFGGGNLSDTAMNYLAHEAVAKISTAVTRLAGVGAKQFMVGNAFNWANLPGIVGTDFAKPMMVFQNRMNSRLPAEMDELAGRLNVKIIVFDFFTAGERIRSNANQYGITHLTDPCTTIPETRGEICATPDEYYYWGNVFLTRRVHQLLGEAMAEQLSK